MSYATLRTIHGVLALALAALLAFFAVSGWLIIHNTGTGTASERVSALPAPAVSGEGEDIARVNAVAREAAERAGLRGAHAVRAKFSEGAWRVTLTRVARSAEVTLTPGVAEARVTLRDAALGGGAKRLHRVRAQDATGARLAWVLLVDVLSLALLLFAFTGVWMFLRLKRDRRLGWALLGASTLYTCGGIAWLALSR